MAIDDNETTETPKAIKGVDKETVHRICSGQVVLDLKTAIKELLENSVDAGASNIEIRLKEGGTQLLEVIDNGHGVRDTDFQGLTIKHATSKLTTFSDLFSVSTFGFRGEALSSLCALGQVSISTRHQSSEIGTALEFDHHGKIVSQKNQARSVGTSVSIKDLFSTMPVRRKEFLRNSRREFTKMIQILQAYCLISNGIRITCTDVTAKGKKMQVMATNGNGCMRENIVDVFGPKQMQHLEEIQWDLDKQLSEEALEHFNIRIKQEGPDAIPAFRVSGFVSSVVHGQGRASNDRQFYFVNGRPCEPNKLAKIVNETYHQFNRHQNPFVCLNVETNREEVDVNITPDKRQVLFENEKYLLATVRSALLQIFDKTPSTYEVQTPKLFDTFSISTTLPSTNAMTADESDDVIQEKDESCLPLSLASLRQSFTVDGTSANGSSSVKMASSKRRKVDIAKTCSANSTLTNYFEKRCETKTSNQGGDHNLKPLEEQLLPELSLQKEPVQEQHYQEPLQARAIPQLTFIRHLSVAQIDEESRESPSPVKMTVKIWDDEENSELKVDKKCRKTKCVPFSMDALKSNLVNNSVTKKSEGIYRRFLAKISPTDNETAEEELAKEFHRDDFRRMTIFGQFNLGFIIAGKGDDLFIVDQHATDEKYNFERLQVASFLIS